MDAEMEDTSEPLMQTVELSNDHMEGKLSATLDCSCTVSVRYKSSDSDVQKQCRILSPPMMICYQSNLCLAVADIREVPEYGSERLDARDPDSAARPEPEATSRADPFRGEHLVRFWICEMDVSQSELWAQSQAEKCIPNQHTRIWLKLWVNISVPKTSFFMQWKVEDFARRNEAKIHSEIFEAGGFYW